MTSYLVDLMLPATLFSQASNSDIDRVGHPLRRMSASCIDFVVQRNLDEIGTAKVTLAKRFVKQHFKADVSGPENPPATVVINALVSQGEGGSRSFKEIPFFEGLLTEIAELSPNDRSYSLAFSDPLVTCCERDQPRQFHDESLQAIVAALCLNAFQKRPLPVFFRTVAGESDKSIPIVECSTNREFEDFDFIRNLLESFGYRLFYQVGENAGESGIICFQPDYSQVGQVVLSSESAKVLESSTRLARFADSVTYTDFQGDSFRVDAGSFTHAGKAFQDRLRFRREKQGYNLEQHRHLPNIKSKQGVESLCKAEMMNRSWHNQTVRFLSQQTLHLGQNVQLDFKDSFAVQSISYSGTFLISGIRIAGGSSELGIEYKGVRP